MSEAQRPIYAPIPLRALGDQALSGADLRTLGAIAAHDRFTKNGTGCFASHVRLGVMTGLHPKAVARSIGRLRDGGYVTVERNPMNARLAVYRIIYTEEDAAAMRGDGRSGVRPTKPRAVPIGNTGVTDRAARNGNSPVTDSEPIGNSRNEKAPENQQVERCNIFPERDKRFREARLGGEKDAAGGDDGAEIERAEAVAKQVRSREMEPEDGLDALRRILARLRARGSIAVDRVEAIVRALDADAASDAPPIDLRSARASPALLASRASMRARGLA